MSLWDASWKLSPRSDADSRFNCLFYGLTIALLTGESPRQSVQTVSHVSPLHTSLGVESPTLPVLSPLPSLPQPIFPRHPFFPRLRRNRPQKNVSQEEGSVHALFSSLSGSGPFQCLLFACVYAMFGVQSPHPFIPLLKARTPRSSGCFLRRLLA